MAVLTASMRICLLYDCLFPHTVGGAERWYRALAESLAADGHHVTYLTLRQWEPGEDPGVPGVDVRAVGPRMALYTEGGRRRMVPPLVFGLGVLWHLLRHGRRYDAVHTCSFPYFSLLAAAVTRPIGGYGITVDWFEVWSRTYWRDYLGAFGGRIGWIVQRLCALVPQRAFCFSRLYAERLERLGVSDVRVLSGVYTGPTHVREVRPAEPFVLFAGRHIPEKNVPAIVPAIASARKTVPELRALILGDGPEFGKVRQAIADLGLEEVIDAPGFVGSEEVEDAMSRALALILPSRREGYGLVVVEAAAHGVPSVVVRAEDNAAMELISEGENGFIADSASPEDLARAVERTLHAGAGIRASTAAWFERNASRLSMKSSLESTLASYATGHSRSRKAA